jgi:VIT1/CCC1 family predicted Fe2+/Mn2+ transporter
MTNSLRAIYRFWALILFPAVLVQIGAAGYGAFYASTQVGNHPTLTQKQWDHGFGVHIALGYFLFLASLLLFVFALGARLGRKGVLLALAAPVLFFLQIVLARLGNGTPAIGVLHPLNALFIAALTGYLAHQAWGRRWS